MRFLVRGRIAFFIILFCVVNIVLAAGAAHANGNKESEVAFSITDGTLGAFSGDIVIQLLSEETKSGYIFTATSDFYKDGAILKGTVAEGKYKVTMIYQNKDKFQILNADATSIFDVEVGSSGKLFNWIISPANSPEKNEYRCSDLTNSDNDKTLSAISKLREDYQVINEKFQDSINRNIKLLVSVLLIFFLMSIAAFTYYLFKN